VLFDPLGISKILWAIDPDRIPVGGMGLNLSPRDTAKLGYLFLHNGMCDNESIVFADWFQNASAIHVKTGVVVGTGVALDYGLMWWDYPRLKAYAALGYDGQTIFNIPDLDLEVVTTAATVNHDHDDIFSLIEKYIVPAVKDMPADFLTASQ